MLDDAGTNWRKGVVTGKLLRDAGVVVAPLKYHVSINIADLAPALHIPSDPRRLTLCIANDDLLIELTD